MNWLILTKKQLKIIDIVLGIIILVLLIWLLMGI